MRLLTSSGCSRTSKPATVAPPEVEQTCEQVLIINKGKLVATDSVHNLQNRARGAESVLVEVEGHNSPLDAQTIQHRLETVNGVSRVLLKESRNNRSVFEVESLKDRFIRGDLARAIVESGWNLNELKPAAMSLEEIFLQLTGAEKVEEPPPLEAVAQGETTVVQGES